MRVDMKTRPHKLSTWRARHKPHVLGAKNANSNECQRANRVLWFNNDLHTCRNDSNNYTLYGWTWETVDTQLNRESVPSTWVLLSSSNGEWVVIETGHRPWFGYARFVTAAPTTLLIHRMLPIITWLLLLLLRRRVLTDDNKNGKKSCYCFCGR